MLETGLEALTLILQPERLLFMAAGVCVGLVVGVMPGLGGTVGMSILLPFVYGMDPFSGVALLIGMAAVVHTSDTFPSVLLGVPGSSGSQATVMDGYPLAQQGQAGRALGAAFTASLIGGIFGAIVLFGVIAVARPLILALGNPELFMLALFGLSIVAVLSQGSLIAGLTAGLGGMLFAYIGAAPAAAEIRYTFDIIYLYNGIPLALIALGLFAIPEMVDLVAADRAIARESKITAGRLDGVRDVFRNKWLVLRNSALGTAVGCIPGLGGSVVDWFAYALTRRTVRDTSQFGKGDIRGVIGPEAANNAKEGGTLMPALLFGIPGSGTTAVLLGGLILLGLQAGPSMLEDDLDVTLSVAWTLALANVLGATLCVVLSRQVSKLALVPAKRLVPFLLVVVVLAAYQASRHWGDIFMLLLLGVLGWVMKNVGWPRIPFLIGFVLAVPVERYLHLSMSLHGYGLFTRPIVVIVAVLILLLIFGRPLASLWRARQEQKSMQPSSR